MIFMDPKSDIGFKKLFGDNKRKNILISFLNSVLERQDNEQIVSIEILDPINNHETYYDKFSIIDIRCKDKADKTYIIEMQKLDEKDFLERGSTELTMSDPISCNALMFSRQLKDGEKYHLLTPVIFVGVLNFNLFASPEFLSHHLILNSKTHEHALKHMEFHFLELPKFDKKVIELNGLVDKWIYILKNAPQLNIIPQELKKPAVIEEAMESLERGTWTDIDLYNYDKYWDTIRNEASALETAKSEGKLEEKRAIARELLANGSDIAFVQKVTGLSIDEIQNLKK
jgi:predicted transposase/invertase (TIGR01784 family)